MSRESSHIKTLSEAFCTPSWFHFSILSHNLARTLPSPRINIRFNIGPRAFVSSFSGFCIDSSTLVPAFAAHNPNTSCTRLRLLHFDPLFSPCRAPSPKLLYSNFPACVWSLLANTLVLHIPLHLHVFVASSASHAPVLVAATHHSVRCFFASTFLLTKTNFSHGFSPTSSQSFHACFHQAVEAA